MNTEENLKQEFVKQLTFEQELESILNKYSKENASNTPDFMLAKYLSVCLENYNETVKARDEWFGVDMWLNEKLLKKLKKLS